MAQTFILPRALPRDRVIAAVYGFLSGLAPDKAWKLEVCEHRKRRTDTQNSYLWGVVYPAFKAELPGWDSEDVHDYLLGEHFGWERIEGMGRARLKPIKRSSKLSTTEFADYVDFCIRKGAEHCIHVPEPTP